MAEMSDVTAKIVGMVKASTEQILAAYREAGSVWAAAKALGVPGRAVADCLTAIGHSVRSRAWTPEETAELATLVENLVPLGEIAHRLGRPYAGVACKASELGIKAPPRRQRKVPRGAGYDKATMKTHVVALWNFDGTLVQFVRSRSLQIEPFTQAFQTHYPGAWADYTKAKGVGEQCTCPYCEAPFYPMSARQKFCTSTCSGDARRDEQYFGGKRRQTVGLGAGICQLCAGERAKGMSAHHVRGKANDPENTVLIALCRGCHQLVSQLGTRKFTEDPAAWESLISLVWMRRNGAELQADRAVHVQVEMDVVDLDDAPVLAQAA